MSLRSIQKLRESLPEPVDIETQAQAILALILEPTNIVERIDCGPGQCPNCGGIPSSPRTPYCGDACREMAGFIRQMRTGIQEGWIFERDKQIALGQVLWHLLGGGRPLRQAIAPGAAIKRAFTRAEGKCEACGAPATAVDHLGSGCNRPSNLRAVCDSCCTDRPFSAKSILSNPNTQRLIKEISARIASSEPMHVCDDAETWDWRAYLAKAHS